MGMFSIAVEFQGSDKDGLEALDWRRIRGLADSSRVRFPSCFSVNGRQTRTVEVPESFARKHLEAFRHNTSVTARVDFDRAVKGDLIDADGTVAPNPEMSDERIRELWEMAR